jgi:hypothetical protein
MKRTVGIDVSPEEEELGLDMAQIGEKAYDQEVKYIRITFLRFVTLTRTTHTNHSACL